MKKTQVHRFLFLVAIVAVLCAGIAPLATNAKMQAPQIPAGNACPVVECPPWSIGICYTANCDAGNGEVCEGWILPDGSTCRTSCR